MNIIGFVSSCIIIKILFHKSRNTQIKVYTIQDLELETGKTWKACSIVHWEVTCQVLIASIAVINLFILKNM